MRWPSGVPTLPSRFQRPNRPNRPSRSSWKAPGRWWKSYGIHGAAIYGVPWIPLIYPSHVSIYTSTMDPSWDMDFREVLIICLSKNWVTDWLEEFICFCCSMCLYIVCLRWVADSLWTVASPVNLKILKGYSGKAPWNKQFLKDVNLLIQLATGFCLSGKRKDGSPWCFAWVSWVHVHYLTIPQLPGEGL
jgi:hypothetical protein